MRLAFSMAKSDHSAWVHRGFAAFAKGSFGSGGDNLYVNAHGVIETIHRFGFNRDGHVDIVFPNTHGYIERGPTWIYTQPSTVEHPASGSGSAWARQELPNDSGCMSRAVDLDGDGHLELIVVNGENGVTSELDSYIYWGGPGGLTGERMEIPTAGAYDVATVDLTGNGLLDIILPSAWVDHHNAGKPLPIQVLEQVEPRKFVDATQRHGLTGIAGVSIVCEDVTGNGWPDLVVANYRTGFEYDTDSYIYVGKEGGFETPPLRLPTHYALQVVLGDLDADGRKEIIFTGGNQIHIFWNREGRFSPGHRTILETEGLTTMSSIGAARICVADVTGDGRCELLIATVDGIEIRSQDDLAKVAQFLPLQFANWVEVADLDGDGRLDVIASKHANVQAYETESAIFWNGPDGFSPERVTWLETTGAVGAAAGDLDGDGRPEVIFSNTLRGPSQTAPDFPVYVYLGNAAGEYSTDRRLGLPTGGGSNTYVIGDFDLDGYADLAFVTMEGLRIFHGGPEGVSPDRYTIVQSPCELPHYVLMGDFNHNGWIDLLSIGYTYDDKPETRAKSTVIFHGGPEGYSAERSTLLPTFTANGQVGDFNQDGWLDVITYNKNGYLEIYLGGPDGFSGQRQWRIPFEGSPPDGASGITCADLNGNGWLDVIFGVMGHYGREQSGFYILYGGPDGYTPERTDFHPTEASPILISVADLNNNGHLDLLVPAYSTAFSRELPAHVYRGSEDGFDFDNPLRIPCDSSCAFQAVDISGNGYLDLLAVCHRNDLGHQVESVLFANGPDGLCLDSPQRLPALGPHLASPRDFGNAFTREPHEHYISPAYDTQGRQATRLSWTAVTPPKTQLKFELRWAGSEAALAAAPWSGMYEQSGAAITPPAESGQWLQYRASFVSLNGASSAQLEEVRIDFG